METASNIQTEKLSWEEIHIHLCESAQDFTYSSQQFISDYARKLAEHADFITMRDSRGNLKGIVAYYANNGQFAYITHIWVADSYRGRGGFAAK